VNTGHTKINACLTGHSRQPKRISWRFLDEPS
jgi:hypothetical protein